MVEINVTIAKKRATCQKIVPKRKAEAVTKLALNAKRQVICQENAQKLARQAKTEREKNDTYQALRTIPKRVSFTIFRLA